jgi:uncharacterized protein (DUF433 family)
MDDELIARYVAEDPELPGPLHARLKESGEKVWLLIAYLRGAAGGDIARTAADYELPKEAVRAAEAYYRRHKALIDARIAVNV